MIGEKSWAGIEEEGEYGENVDINGVLYGVELRKASEVDIFDDSIEKMMEVIISRPSSIYISEGCNTVKLIKVFS